MSIMDLISSLRAGNTQQPAADPNVAGNQQNANTTTFVDANKTIPNNTTQQSDGTLAAIPPVKSGETSPLDNYKDLFTIDTSKSAAPTSLVPSITIDPAKLMESAKKMDFTKNINPELFAKAVKGDAASFAAVLNEGLQSAWAQGAAATLHVTKQALTEQEVNFNKMMPDILRRHSISNDVGKDNPLFSNPATAPLMQAMETQLASKFPQASAAEITAHVKQYLSGFASEVVKMNGGTIVAQTSMQNSNGVNREVTDWEKYFDVSPAA